MASLLHDISRNIYSLQTSQFFINAAPFSGKSAFIESLGNKLAQEIMGISVIGPICFVPERQDLYCKALIEAFQGRLCLDEAPESPIDEIAPLWDWLASNLHAANKRFVILLDIDSQTFANAESLAQVFSALRGLETGNSKRNFKQHHILVSYWNHSALQSHYHSINISFPYTVGNNYQVWYGLEELEVLALLPNNLSLRELYAGVIHELTAGHGGLISELIAELKTCGFSLKNILLCLRNLAQTSESSRRFLSAWQALPTNSLELIEELLLHRYLPVQALAKSAEQTLVVSGIATRKVFGKAYYLHFNSWYVELLLRNQAELLGIRNETIRKMQFSEIMPEIQSINKVAYELIYDIETNARNLAIKILAAEATKDSQLLAGFMSKDSKKNLRDLSEIAEETRGNSDLDLSLNPLISFISTRQLAELLDDIGQRYRLKFLHTIAKLMHEVAPIRNAVMHNQLIDETALLHLQELQAQIYASF